MRARRTRGIKTFSAYPVLWSDRATKNQGHCNRATSEERRIEPVDQPLRTDGMKQEALLSRAG